MAKLTAIWGKLGDVIAIEYMGLVTKKSSISQLPVSCNKLHKLLNMSVKIYMWYALYSKSVEKVNFAPEQAIRAQRRSRRTVLLFL